MIGRPRGRPVFLALSVRNHRGGARSFCLIAIGEASNAAPTPRSRRNRYAGRAWMHRVNSLGLLDLQIAAEGLTPKFQYSVYLAASDQLPFGRLEPLAVLKTNLDGAGTVQTVGPLKTLAASGANHDRRTLAEIPHC